MDTSAGLLDSPSSHDVSARHGRDLILATKQFAKEDRTKSWRLFLLTLLLYLGTLGLAITPLPWPLRTVASILAALLMVRLFVMFHDHQHRAILDRSPTADFLMRMLGLWTLAPSSVWQHTHNYHHQHNSKLLGSHLGSFPIMTRAFFHASGFWRRFSYLVMRHPLTLLSGYVTTFLLSMCLVPLLENPREHYDCFLALLLHAAVFAVLLIFGGWPALFFVLLLPHILAAALGTYLFYAQHNFPAVMHRDEDGWTYEGAALESSSFLQLPAWMHWFTANIGYHHIHHLNPRIPFYRLPEAMRLIPELQSPKVTSLHPGEIRRCLRLKVWDVEQQRMTDLQGR